MASRSCRTCRASAPPARPLQHLRRLALQPGRHHERPARSACRASILAGMQYVLRPHRAARQHGPLRRRSGAQRPRLRAARPADQHVRLGDQGAEPRTASSPQPFSALRPQPGASAARRPRHGAAEDRPIRWPRRRSASTSSKSAYDWQAMIDGMRICREIAAQPALKPFVVEEIMPGAGGHRARADLEAYIRATRRLEPAPGRHLPHGPRRRRRRRSAAPGARHRGPARRRRLDHAAASSPATPTRPRS